MLRQRVPAAARLLGAGCSAPCAAVAAVASSTPGRRFLCTRAQDNAPPTTRSTSRHFTQPAAFNQHLQRRRRRQLHTTSAQLQDAAPAADPTTSEQAQEDGRPLAKSTTATFSVGRDVLPFRFGIQDGKGLVERQMDLPLLWLRDMCRCHRCVDPHSGQKYFSTIDLPDQPKVREARRTETGALRVVWESDNLVTSGTTPADEHVSIWDRETLNAWKRDQGRRLPHRRQPERTLWNRESYMAMLSEGKTRFPFAEWAKGGRSPAWLSSRIALRDTGLVFLTGVEKNEETNSLVSPVVRMFGEPMWTFYGSQWDVKSKPQAENVAYTSQYLGLHQDLMYHDPIPRLQFLACVSNSCEGGESLFSDGVRAAYQLKLQHPGFFRELTKPMVRFHYFRHGGRKNYYEREHPTISVSPSGRIESIQWAPPFQAPFKRSADLAKWKEAAAAFEAILSAPENMVTIKLNEGDCVVFDNTRILHGRNEFRTAEGERHLQGMYLSDQDYKMQLRDTHAQQKHPPALENRDLLYLAELRQVKLGVAGFGYVPRGKEVRRTWRTPQLRVNPVDG